MNRNYKVIWNEALRCFVAVAEYAKGRSKSSSMVVHSNVNVSSSNSIGEVRILRLSTLRSGLVAVGFTSLALSMSPQVFAAVGVDGGIGSGTAISNCTSIQQANSGNNAENIAIGCSSSASNTGLIIADRGNPYYTDNVTNSATVNAADRNAYTPRGEEGGSVAIGTGSKTERTFGVALGEYAKTTNIAGVAIGTGSLSKGNTALALGRQSVATGDYSQAIGNVSAATGKGSLAVGHSATATGYRAIAIGATDIDGASASYGQSGANYQAVGQTKATANDTIAFGSGAQATAENALALGAFSAATSAGSVAIGTGSTTAVDANSVTSATINGITYNNFAGSTNIAAGDQISVGASGQERQIKNVAAGDVTATSTDAINGSQLYSVADTLSESINDNADNIDKGLNFTGDNTTVTINRKLGQALNIKGGATDLTENNIGVVVDGTNSLAIKLAKDINLGVTGSVTTGNTLVDNDGVTLVGGTNQTIRLNNNGLNNGGNKITSVADGSIATDSRDAVNGGQLNNTANSITSVIGGNAVNNGGIVTSTDIGGTGKNTIDEAILSVNNAATAAKSTVTQGDNIVVTSSTNADGSTNYKVATTDELKVTSVTAGNSTLNNNGLAVADDEGNTTTVTTAGTTVTNAAGNSASYGANGFTTSDSSGNSTTVDQTGVSFSNSNGATGPSITAGGIDAGTTVITNVVSGGTTVTNAANIGDVLTAAAGSRTEVAAGSNVTNVVKTTGSNGQDIYTVNANGASVSSSGAVTVTPAAKNANNITDYAVDLSQASKDSLVKADTAVQTIVTQIDGTAVKTVNQANNTANFVTGENILLSNDNGSIRVATAQNLVVTSIKTGNTTINNEGLTIKDGPSITTNGIDAGNKVITNVANGVNANDAANVGQLNSIDRVVSGQIATIDRNIDALGYRVGEIEDDANAGISAAMAMSSLPQAYIPGKSMVGGGIASYNGESAVAIGMSRVSDNGRWVMKINGSADTQGNAGGAIGAGFHF